MKQVIFMLDGSRVEVDGNNVKHIREDGKVLYDYTIRQCDNDDAWDPLDDYDADWK